MAAAQRNAWHQRQQALALQGSSGGSGGPSADHWPGPHSPPQHSADSGIGTGSGPGGYSLHQMGIGGNHQQQRHHLNKQQSSESSASQRVSKIGNGLFQNGKNFFLIN
jgi:hypothetical protein